MFVTTFFCPQNCIKAKGVSLSYIHNVWKIAQNVSFLFKCDTFWSSAEVYMCFFPIFLCPWRIFTNAANQKCKEMNCKLDKVKLRHQKGIQYIDFKELLATSTASLQKYYIWHFNFDCFPKCDMEIASISNWYSTSFLYICHPWISVLLLTSLCSDLKVQK